MRSADVLLLDDLGVECCTLWADEKLFQLINHRCKHRLSMIITMNERAWPRLDERIQSRLCERRLVTTVIWMRPLVIDEEIMSLRCEMLVVLVRDGESNSATLGRPCLAYSAASSQEPGVEAKPRHDSQISRMICSLCLLGGLLWNILIICHR